MESSNRRLWAGLALVVLGSFTILVGGGTTIYRNVPPIPDRIESDDGTLLATGEDITRGQQVWQRMGGQQVGSVWGHGAYTAPDWSADWLHREAEALLGIWTARLGTRPFSALDPETQGSLKARLLGVMRANRFDPSTGRLRVAADRALAGSEVAAHYDALFGADPALDRLRDAYAIRPDSVPDPLDRASLAAFFAWAAWACVANRPGTDVSYTMNWPPDELVGNRPSGAMLLWSILSVVLLLAGVGALAWWTAADREAEGDPVPPAEDPLGKLEPTPSMRATGWFALAAVGLFTLQVVFGVVTAHYGVEGQGLFGIPLARWLPYSLARTWHIQLGLFWIATLFLAGGLYLAPVLGGHEPRGQRAGVLALLGALVVVVLGSLAGQALAIHQRLGLDLNFWVGHQGYEYVDLGRVWQIALWVGLLGWLVLMTRALMPALLRPSPTRQLIVLLFLSVVAIGTFYGVGLLWGPKTHLAVAEYWRWWVVHLWVEGFFEVFATCALALLFVNLGLLSPARATTASLFSTILFLGGGIIGTFHHLYFSGTPIGIMALGATFSALEVVPLVLIGFEAHDTWKRLPAAAWARSYDAPVRFFVAVAFWNFVGAGLFGFLINPPIALYYMQGLNTTPVHGHTALFGVYGLLALGLMLLILRGLTDPASWSEKWLSRAFWGMNLGLVLMVGLSLLPVGLMQAAASMEHGMWYARSAELLQSPTFVTLRWLRVPGDLVFCGGLASLLVFISGLRTRAGATTRIEDVACTRALP